MDKKLVLITGASSGIGAAAAKEFAKKGFRLALVGRRSESLTATANEIKNNSNVAVETFVFDFDNLSGVDGLISQVVKTFSASPDIVLHCVGSATLGNVENVPLAAYESEFRINVFSTVALAKASLPFLKEKKEAYFIPVLSGASQYGLPGVSPYCSSKSALESFAQSLRAELKSSSVKVVFFSPGPVNTPFYQRQIKYGDLAETFNPKKMAEPETVAAALVKACLNGKTNINLSFRSKIVGHLHYWVPGILEKIVSHKVNQKSTLSPKRVVDIHGYYDESRIDIARYKDLLDANHIETLVLSAPCTKVHEPDKSEFMYSVQRVLLKSGLLRPVAGLIAKSFYNAEGKLRPFWRLFTRGGKQLNKVLEPDNDRLEQLIAADKTRLRMWYWINPASAPSLSVLREKLNNPQIIGLKFHAYWHGFNLKQMAPYLDLCKEKKLPVYLILGFGVSGNYDWILENYPEVPVIFGYGGFPFFKKLWKKVASHPNRYIDLTSNHLDRSLIQKALSILGPDRCLYGSDCPYNFPDGRGGFSYAKTFQRIENPSLSETALEAIYFGNFTRLTREAHS